MTGKVCSEIRLKTETPNGMNYDAAKCKSYRIVPGSFFPLPTSYVFKMRETNGSGCGAHVEQVLGDVPATERCHCREQSAKVKTGESAHTPHSWLKRIFGKIAF